VELDTDHTRRIGSVTARVACARSLQSNYIRRVSPCGVTRSDSAQQTWRDIPLAAVIGNDCHRLLVVSGEHTFDRVAFSRLKTDSVADPELKHPGMRTHLPKEAKAFDNPMVQVDEFSFAQPVNIDLYHSATFRCKKPGMPMT
jgi:hypothetical protein